MVRICTSIDKINHYQVPGLDTYTVWCRVQVISQNYDSREQKIIIVIPIIKLLLLVLVNKSVHCTMQMKKC